MDQMTQIEDNQEKWMEWKKSVMETAKKILGGGRQEKKKSVPARRDDRVIGRMSARKASRIQQC